MAQNSFFPDANKHEATKAQANAHHHNCLYGKDIVPKLLRPSLQLPANYIEPLLSLFLGVKISAV